MLKIAICDNDAAQLKIIHASAERYFSARGEQEAQIECFSAALAFLERLDKTGGCDIALLDVCMPGLLGTDVAREIRKRRDRTEIIFLTTSNEYAVDAFALKAAHYLLKPFTQAQFDEAMDRAVSLFLDGAPVSIAVRAESGELYNVDIDDIFYIESADRSLTVYTRQQTICESRRSIARLLESLDALSPGQFISPYKGYIVNQKAIRAIEKDKIVLKTKQELPIPRRGYRELQDTYFNYMFTEGGTKL
ncbi:MAG: LytTR family DNA-binding domain-containing protein [Oscillibacter sp.]|jgi:DNA-binding LytR/AlgR family response regulator|nr:LytTR family DNA-binding domain-containing protein [Oscillibacter sp.]